jgi:hypothetical protein
MEDVLMSQDVTVKVVESVWRDIVAHEPPGLVLDPAIRDQFRSATQYTDQPSTPVAARIAVFPLEQAEKLEAWLTAVVARPRAPLGSGVALHAVREGIRVVTLDAPRTKDENPAGHTNAARPSRDSRRMSPAS